MTSGSDGRERTPGGVEPPGGGDDLAPVLAAAARGDEQAWVVLVQRYGRRVFALAKSRVRRADLAEEITQSVFATVAIKLREGGYDERGRFESWLFRIAMNRVRDECRRSARQATPADPGTFAIASGDAPDHDGRDAQRELDRLRDAMDELGDADREVIELRHHAQMSFKQIAEQLGEPMGTLLARHHRALRKLRAILEGSPAAGGAA
ncbi:MAG: putative RNA polymerase sigma E protein [Phycisphaeraceae bacterium]|nr:MAG: putative RNA polymerase sigma E protein [Phycisphaeraceae bacterium]